LAGVKIQKISLDFAGEVPQISGEYNLMSSADTVVAKQTLNGYGGMPYQPSGDTLKLLCDLRAQVRRDINTSMGIEL
jgi:hypothetical protein